MNRHDTDRIFVFRYHHRAVSYGFTFIPPLKETRQAGIIFCCILQDKILESLDVSIRMDIQFKNPNKVFTQFIDRKFAEIKKMSGKIYRQNFIEGSIVETVYIEQRRSCLLFFIF